MESKYKGIDSRDIKCCCNNPKCIESGISIEDDFLYFHYLDYIMPDGRTPLLIQKSKTMKLNKQTRDELVKQLKEIKF